MAFGTMTLIYVGIGGVAGYMLLPMVYDNESSPMYGAILGAGIGYWMESA